MDNRSRDPEARGRAILLLMAVDRMLREVRGAAVLSEHRTTRATLEEARDKADEARFLVESYL